MYLCSRNTPIINANTYQKMKKMLSSLVLTLMSALLFVACSSSSNNDTPQPSATDELTGVWMNSETTQQQTGYYGSETVKTDRQLMFMAQTYTAYAQSIGQPVAAPEPGQTSTIPTDALAYRMTVTVSTTDYSGVTTKTTTAEIGYYTLANNGGIKSLNLCPQLTSQDGTTWKKPKSQVSIYNYSLSGNILILTTWDLTTQQWTKTQ